MFTRLTWLLSPTFWLFIFKTINRNVVSSGESGREEGFRQAELERENRAA
jgi:hypothetical protein